MSRASKITFGASCLFALTSIAVVHYVQGLEQETLHQGPIKDAKRMAEKQAKKLRNEEEYRQQQLLTEKYSAIQPLSGDIIHGTDDNNNRPDTR